jgi:magnesium transporter
MIACSHASSCGAALLMRRATEDDRSEELTPYFEDLYDHVLRAAEWTESLRDMITSIFETNMALADNRMNVVMKKLTSWAAIIAVPTAITGWFGQNVPYPRSAITPGST